MKKELMQYVPLVKFLKEALGERFNVSLVDAEDTGHEISLQEGSLCKTSISRQIQVTLFDDILNSRVLKTNDYICSFSDQADPESERKFSVFNIRAEDGGIAGFLCIEEMRGELYMVREVFDEIMKPEGLEAGGSGRIGQEVDSLLEERIAQVWQRYNTSATKLKKAEKIAFISELFEMGIFRIRGGAAMVSQVTGISQASLYRYLGEIIEE